MGATGNTPASITPPDRVESRLGTLEFNDGAPSPATAELLYDHLDFIQGVQAFINAFPGASLAAMHDGFLSIGVQDNEILLFSELMDSASLFLTANCDTVYFITFIDLADGPMVLDVPPFGPPSGILGAIDDMWFRWVTDFGVSGPDRAQGGRYLIIGPGYDGPVPDSGFHVSHSRTRRVIAFGRAFMIDNDPAPAAKVIRDGIRISPYVPGAQGTPISTFLTGNAPFGPVPDQAEPVFIEGSGKAFNTVPPNDFSYWETVNELVQQEPAGAGEPETMGLLAAVGIVKGKSFVPNDHMRKILQDAVVVGNATARTVSFAPRAEEGFAYCPGSAWFNMLFTGGYEFLDPPPQITADGPVASPSDGARKLNARISFLLPLYRHHPRDVHAAARRRLAIPDRDARQRGRVPRRRPQLPTHAPARHPGEPLLVCDALRPPDPIDAPDRPAQARHRKPIGHRPSQPRRGHRRLLRADRPQRQQQQLDPNRPRQRLLHHPAALQPTPAILRQDLAAKRDTTDRLTGTTRCQRKPFAD
jgi:hypothetical protein